jgi:Helicase conserved C-terminal domain
VTEPTLSPPNARHVRDELEQLVLEELLGPAGGDQEELAGGERPSDRYLVGMLAPRRTPARPDELDALALAGDTPGDEGRPEPEAPPLTTLFASSVGLTCSVDGDATEVRVTAGWGRYVRDRGTAEGGEAAGLVWRREPAGGTVRLRLAEGDLDPRAPDPEQPDVVVRGRARRHEGDWLLTVFLVNDQRQPDRLPDQAWLFQVELALDAADGEAIFRRRPALPGIGEPDPEAESLAMAYRRHVEFAVGHGVGVRVDQDDQDPGRARRIRTATVPAYEVPRTDPPTVADVPELAGVTLDMAALATAPDEDLAGRLLPLVDAYAAWIGRQRARIGDAAVQLDGFEATAEAALEECANTADRIRRGVELLAADPMAAEAFRFANHAMWWQRVHTLAADLRRRDPDLSLEAAVEQVDIPANRSWRPFQLAFFLLNLPSLSDPAHPERGPDGLVDLLWFPTGGGKTEAYLGLTAYTIAMRRLQGTVAGLDGREGVAVLMRYTLRLLTLQQFQRAAALLCACEVLRQEALERGDERLGAAPFRVGLWVGRQATPNRTEEADAWVKQQRGASGFRPGGSSPAQLTTCPWCGSRVNEARDIRVDLDRRRTLLFCGDITGACPFTARRRPDEGLPVVVVDEEVYRLLPALLIGTVDKFAQMPWRGETMALFGRVSGRCERHGFRSPDLEDADSHPRRGVLPAARTVPAGPLRPPDLIIQDELHLIAGPLGSLVGLYETAIDRLCTWEADGRPVRPKVVASTATVRRAGHQVHRLFLRQVKVFPPPGLDAEDSFFAVQRPTGEVPGRRYLGICAHGRRFKHVLIRVFVAELAAAQTLFDKYGGAAVADPYMTLVGYFNSLRELGGMRRLVEDDVASRLGQIDAHGLAKRRRPEVQELTSRLGSSGIPRVLDQLQVPFRTGPTPAGATWPIDVLLATNMIAVGVDVPRLGAMVVGGQPKSTAEYIQATSRIGRANPGLVLTVLNWARPRDLSHYESFEHYHATFYRQVEALSVTPFAARALDRGLTAVLASLVRLSGTDLNANLAAGRLDRHDEALKGVVATVRQRAEQVADEPRVGDEVSYRLETRLDQWDAEAARPHRRLGYREHRGQGDVYGLLREPGIGAWGEWTCPTSLRDVEAEIGLLLSEADLGDATQPPFEPAETADEGEGA